jgi:Membrane protein involved in the export of O-antigen and teichoic acid
MIRKLIVDSLSSGMVPVLKTCITFIMAPLIVHALGNYDYGISEIVMSVVGYMGILDLGLMPAIVRFVARSRALDDLKQLHRIYSTSLAFLVPVGLVLSIGLFAASYAAADIFPNAAAGSAQKYSLFLLVVGVQVFFTFTGAIFDCYLEGLQCYSVRNYTTMIFSIAGAVAMYQLLLNGGGLLSVAAVNGVGYSTKNLFYGFLLLQKKRGGFRFRKEDVSCQTFKDLFSFGIKSFVYSISLRISSLTDSLVIGNALGAVVVPFYVIPVSFLGHARNLIWSMTRNFMPAFTELHAVADLQKIRSLLFDCSRYALGVIVPAVGGICVLGPSFLAHWMGKEYAEKGERVLYLIAASYLLQWLNPFSNRFLTGIGKHGIMARLSLAGSLINLSLSVVLVRFWGIEGVALGTLLPAVFFEPYLLHKMCKELNCGVVEYAKNVFVPLLIPTAVFAAVLRLMAVYYRVESLIDIAVLAVSSIAIYLPVFAGVAMKADERSKIYQIIRKKRSYAS